MVAPFHKIYPEINPPQKSHLIGIMLQVPAAPWVAAEPVGALIMAVCDLSSHDGD
jgi:hypothetical protein